MERFFRPRGETSDGVARGDGSSRRPGASDVLRRIGRRSRNCFLIMAAARVSVSMSGRPAECDRRGKY